MACNFWGSSHRLRWMFTEDFLNERRAANRGEFTLEEVKVMCDLFHRVMVLVGVKLKLRAKVVSTAAVLFKRFYLHASLDQFDPRLIMVTCLYMAAKVEELGQYNLRTLLPGVQDVLKSEKLSKHFPAYSPQYVHDYELYVLEKLGFDLVIFHPYRPLMQYINDSALPDVAQAAWNVVNDAYRTDVVLLFPPYLIALSALYIACAYNKVDVKEWFNRLNVCIDSLRDIVTTLMEANVERAKNLDNYKSKEMPLLERMDVKYKEMLKELEEGHRKRKREQDQKKNESKKKK